MQEKGVGITALVYHFEGERYDDIVAVKQTVGLLNRTTRGKRVREIGEEVKRKVEFLLEKASKLLPYN